ncbi:MAG: T9SS type A sorting domain-containing protein [Bacteroidales bacterium]|nr:T9SS type A sorting domain-containing protein [Bacteroidales bacterium]
MQIKIFIIIFLLALCYCGFSQTQQNIYLSGNENDQAYSICKAGDNYLICGSTRSGSVGSNDIILFEISESGNLNWVNTYGVSNIDEAFDVCYTNNNTIGLTGYLWTDLMHNPFMYLIGQSGSIIKMNYIEDIMAGFGFSTIDDQNGGLSFCGSSAQEGTLGGQAFLAKMNDAGDISWIKKYGANQEEQNFKHIQTDDNGYLLVGTQDGFIFNYIWREYNYASSKIYIIKTDSEGNELWNKTITGSYLRYARAVQQAPDGGYFIIGSTQENSAGSFDMLLIKIDSNGNTEWQKVFGGIDFEYGYDLSITDDNYIFLCGVSKTELTESVDVLIIKTDLSGNTIWKKTIGGNYSEYAYGIESTSENGCMIVGYTNDPALGNGSNNIMVLKLSPSGDIQELLNIDTATYRNVSVYPNPAKDYFNISINQTPNNSLNYDVKIINSKGQMIFSKNFKNDNAKINCSKFASGVYFVEMVFSEKEKHIEKIIVE